MLTGTEYQKHIIATWTERDTLILAACNVTGARVDFSRLLRAISVAFESFRFYSATAYRIYCCRFL